MYSTEVSLVQFHAIIQESLFYHGRRVNREGEGRALQTDLMGKLFYEVAILYNNLYNMVWQFIKSAINDNVRYLEKKMLESLPLNITSRIYTSSYKLATQIRLCWDCILV